GGLHMDACSKEDALVAAFKDFGTRSRIPSLWMYARNDSFFGPAVVERMRSAFLDGGGDAKLVMFDAIDADGQKLFSAGNGRFRWLQEMDGFLRLHGLPTWDRQSVTGLITRLKVSEAERGFLEGFVAAPDEKVLAKASSGYLYRASAFKEIGEARNA